jgi:HSP20 family protein
MAKKIIPVSTFVRLEHEVRRIRSRVVVRHYGRPDWGEGFFPRIDIREKNREVVVELEMPGVCPEDLVILVHRNRLEVKGIKKETPLPEGGTYLRLEREYGPFRRFIDLPTSIQPDKAKAILRNGILTIILTKPEAKKYGG